MLWDGGIKLQLPKGFLHWMVGLNMMFWAELSCAAQVTNIPGNSVGWGSEVMEYVPPFSFELTEDNQLVQDRVASAHPLLMLVFKQKERLVVDETQQVGKHSDNLHSFDHYENI